MSTRVSSATRVIVVGAGGRMGSRVRALASADGAFALVGALVRGGPPRVGEGVAPADAPGVARGAAVKNGDSAAIFGRSCADVVIDFSSESGVRDAIAVARRVGCALLVGTTGLSAETIAALRAESSARAVLVAANTSLGVAALCDLVRRASAVLTAYDCSIVESHHNQKKDAPSGTALRLAEAARLGGSAAPQVVSLRGGDVVGEHTVRFAGAGEYVELTHRATSRDLFARGALHAAAWLKGRTAGWWTMEDVLGMPAR